MQPIPLCMSMLEKYLLKRGWSVNDQFEPHEQVLWTRAVHPERTGYVWYPKATYVYDGRSREDDLQAALEQAAQVEGVSAALLGKQAAAGYADPVAGFVCRVCGNCCLVTADARRSRFSPEEVACWENLGMTRVLRRIRKVERPGYHFYEGWLVPNTGRFFLRCPWAEPLRQGDGAACRIHEVKPLKCRAFPLSRNHAEVFACKGFMPLGDLSSSPGQDTSRPCIHTTSCSSTPPSGFPGKTA